MDLTRNIYLEFNPYLELYTGVRTALTVNEGIIKVIGPEGVGKTAFCQKLEIELAVENYDVIYFAEPPESPEYLHERIQNYLGLDKKKNFNKCLTQYLLDKAPPSNKLIVIYDNAEQIDKEIFILIRLLNNIHNDSETLVSQVVCGTKKLDERFDDPDLRSLTQYLNQSFTLSPMDRNELEDFCAGYLKKTGYVGTGISDNELNRIFKKSKGYPGETITLLKSIIAQRPSDTVKQPSSIVETVIDPAVSGAKEKLAVSSEAAPKPEPQPIPESITGAVPETSNIEDVLEDIPRFTEITEAEEHEEEEKVPGQQEEVASDEDYTQEVNEILDADNEHSGIPVPVYFKIALSLIVLVVSMVLAIILSGENELMNDRLANILAEDTPVFADEVASVSNTTITTAPEDEGLSELEDLEPQSETGTVPDLEIPQSDISPLAESPELLTASEDITEEILTENDFQTTELEQSEISTDIDNATITTTENQEDNLEETALEVASEEEIIPLEVNIEENIDEPFEETGIETEPLVSELSIEEEITTVISTWLDAWQAGDFAGYLAAYHADFMPAYQDTYAEWHDLREARIDGVQGITTSFDRFELLQSTDEEVTARIWLYYSRNTYSDQTLKEILFRLDGERWLILEERNLQIITD